MSVLIFLLILAVFLPLIAFVMWAEKNYIKHKEIWRNSLQKPPAPFEKRTFGFKHKRDKFPEFKEE